MKIQLMNVIAASVICWGLGARMLTPIALAQEKGAAAFRLPVDYSAIIAKLKEQLPQQMAQMNLPGLAIALVDGETLVWAEGFGVTERNTQAKVTADTLFSLQSISKTCTATGFLMAFDKGWMKPDDSVTKYAPQFRVQSRFGKDEVNRITIRHLLSHRAGLIHPAPCAYNNEPCNFAEHIKSLSETWLKFPAGTGFAYSNLGVDAAGYALEKRARKPFDQVMRDELLRPLGMTSSTFNQQEAGADPMLAKGHQRNNVLPFTPLLNGPSGGMFTTAKDMARFLSFHLTGGVVAGKRVLPERWLNEMYAPQSPVAGQLGGYGLGIATEPWRRGRLLGHGGSGFGYAASLSWVPEYQVGVVVLTNSEQGNALAVGTVQSVLQEMIEAKYARRGSARFTDQPVVALEPQLLLRLEGSYKPDRNSLIAFKAKENHLYFIAGKTEVKLNAHNPTEFTGGDRKFTFLLNEAGVPKGVQVLSFSGAEFMALNDRPNESPGPNKPEWQPLLGKYAEASGNTTTVTVRNGYLYIGWDGELKLTEQQNTPAGLFFTADGEVVRFHEDKLYLRGIRPFQKEKTGKL